MWRCCVIIMFSRFDTIPACDRHTHRHDDIAYTARLRCVRSQGRSPPRPCVGRLKMREWKMRYGPKCKGGKCRSGKCGSKSSGLYQRLENAAAYFVGEFTNIFYSFILISMIVHMFTVLKKFSGCTKFGLPKFNKDRVISVQR